MDIKILVAAHKKYWMPNDDVYLPIHVGREGKQDIGYTGDNTGDNISAKNANYCELTGLYWAWKNLECDYIGLCHYRRYFTKQEVFGSNRKKEQILSKADWEKLLSKAPIILPDKRRYYIETNYSHYIHAHPAIALDETRNIVKEFYPDYIAAYDKVMERTWAHMFNMYVMRKDYFDEYHEWLFRILFELEKRIDISGWDAYEARVFGFVSELLLDVWIEQNKVNYVEQNVSFIEKQNWPKKIAMFLKRKFG